MKRFARGTLVALVLCSVPTLADPPQKQPTPQAAEETITVRAGNARTLEAPGVTRVALGDPEIADVEVTGDNVLRIDGRKAGETKLLVWTGEKRKAYRIVVQ
jgi:pilus assembly protein CpaC